MRILVIEGEPGLGDDLKKGLEASGHVLDTARDGVEGRLLATLDGYALILLDVMRPGIDGFAALQALRRTSNVPVLVLTDRDKVEDRVSGLQQGADDYLVKPFSLPELLARVEALLGRGTRQASTVLRLADLALDPASRTCIRNRTRIDLTAKEFMLLALLLRHHGEILSRRTLGQQVWDATFDNNSNVVEVTIRRLRSKIDDAFDVKLLHTVRGSGYVLEDRS